MICYVGLLICTWRRNLRLISYQRPTGIEPHKNSTPQQTTIANMPNSRARKRRRNRQKRKKRPIQSRVSRAQRIANTPLTESERALRYYAWARINPFSAPACGIPKGSASRSSKHKNFFRATAHVGTAGTGFLFARPSPVYDYDSIWWSSATYTGTVNATSGVGVSVGRWNTPYATASYTANDVAGRVVSYGMRMRYTGTELEKAGRLCAFAHPTGETLDGHDLTDILKYPTALTVPVTRKWVSIVNKSGAPSTNSTNNAGHEMHNYTSSTTFGRNADVCISFTGTPGSSWEFECYEIYEIIGTHMAAPTTSHNATAMSDAINAVIDAKPSTHLDHYANLDVAQVTSQGLSLANGAANTAQLAIEGIKGKIGGVLHGHISGILKEAAEAAFAGLPLMLL